MAAACCGFITVKSILICKISRQSPAGVIRGGMKSLPTAGEKRQKKKKKRRNKTTLNSIDSRKEREDIGGHPAAHHLLECG